MKKVLVLLTLLSVGSIFAKTPNVDFHKAKFNEVLNAEDREEFVKLTTELNVLVQEEENEEVVEAVMKEIQAMSYESLDEFDLELGSDIDGHKENFGRFMRLLDSTGYGNVLPLRRSKGWGVADAAMFLSPSDFYEDR